LTKQKLVLLQPADAHVFYFVNVNQTLVFQIIPLAIGSGKSLALRAAAKRYVRAEGCIDFRDFFLNFIP
jgi:hypothetical protein